MKTILVTGGSGFLGSHLCKKLLDLNHYLICLDNFYTGRKKNIEELIENPNFELIKRDVISPLYLEKVDQIYNLACPASPIHYQKDPIKTFKTSILGAMNMLNLAIDNNSKILQTSTSEVYGDPIVHPQKENYWGNVNPIGLRSNYDESKRGAETLFMDYHRKYNLKIKIVRIFNTYGPNMHPDDGRVVSNFIVQALKNDPITVYGDGTQTRSFCYVDDMIYGLTLMMNSHPNIIGPINLGNPEEFTILELANKVIELTNSKSKIIYKPLPSDDPIRRKPDISLAESSLFWKPYTKLEDGLIKTIEYFEKEISQN